jgi:FdhD protein
LTYQNFSMKNVSTTPIKIKKASSHQLFDANDQLAIEEPLEIQIIYQDKTDRIQRTISITMRTPGNDEDLALGFLFTEGIIQNKRQIANTHISPFENKALITINENETLNLQNTERNFYTTSSCGVCGKTSIEAIKTISIYNITDNIHISPSVFYQLEQQLRKQQTLFDSTGGLHASALFNLEGNFITLREDVGRHNALDKLIGAAFSKEELPLTNKILLLSGRASFELVQKATMAGIKIIAAVGAPSSLAVQLAEEAGITLVGFLRNEQFNIYTGEERISEPEFGEIEKINES